MPWLGFFFFFAFVGWIISLLLRCLFETSNPRNYRTIWRKGNYSFFYLIASFWLHKSDQNENEERMKRGNSMLIQMFVPEASLRLYSLPQKRKKKTKSDEKEEEEEEGNATLCVHFCFGAVNRLCSLPQIRQSCFVLCTEHRLCESKSSYPASV